MSEKMDDRNLSADGDAVDLCAHELRQIGDGFYAVKACQIYWGYKLMEVLIKNYTNVTKIK